MVTEEEKQEIIDKAVEKAMLVLPEVVGNLMAQHVALSKMNSKFYAEHPEFAARKDIVASVIEKIDGENPLMKYEDLLVKAIPEIRKRMEVTSKLDTATVRPIVDRNFNGEI